MCRSCSHCKCSKVPLEPEQDLLFKAVSMWLFWFRPTQTKWTKGGNKPWSDWTGLNHLGVKMSSVVCQFLVHCTADSIEVSLYDIRLKPLFITATFVKLPGWPQSILNLHHRLPRGWSTIPLTGRVEVGTWGASYHNVTHKRSRRSRFHVKVLIETGFCCDRSSV